MADSYKNLSKIKTNISNHPGLYTKMTNLNK